MIKTAFTAFASVFLIVACASQEPLPETQSPTAETESTPPENQKRLGLKRPCPEQIHLSAYRNMMPGPGYDRENVPVGISLVVSDGEGWAVSHEAKDEGDAIVLSLFRTYSTHVKPPARSLAPMKVTPGQKKPQARRAPFRIVSNATHVTVRCDGEIIAETPIGAAH